MTSADPIALKKAQFVLGGDVSIPEGFDSELFDHRDGKAVSAVFSFCGTRARKKLSNNGEFSLEVHGDRLSILRNGEPFLDSVGIIRMYCHSPNLAVVSLSDKNGILPVEKVIEKISFYQNNMDLNGISLHKGPDCTEDHYISSVSKIHAKFPSLPIGVDPNLTTSDLKAFKDAGAVNYKTTIETFVPRIASSLEIDMNTTMARLEEAVSIFGRGNVVATFYVGLGETIEEVSKATETLCKAGILPDIKALKSNPKRKVFEDKLGPLAPISPEIYAQIATSTKTIMSECDIEPSGYNTMCYGCRLCTIVPFKDF